MRDNDGMRPPSDRLAEDFPRMYCHGRDTALRDRDRLTDRMEVRIDRQNKEVLLLRRLSNDLQEHLDGRRRGAGNVVLAPTTVCSCLQRLGLVHPY